MKTTTLGRVCAATAAAVLALSFSACARQSRGNADVEENSAQTTAEGGSVTTKGVAGEPRAFGDVEARKKAERESAAGKSPIGTGSTGGPGAREIEDVTIRMPEDRPPEPTPQR